MRKLLGLRGREMTSRGNTTNGSGFENLAYDANNRDMDA
jgi:hypothetical protein